MMAKVKEYYGIKVPDGADRWGLETYSLVGCFIKHDVRGSYWWIPVVCECWKFVGLMLSRICVDLPEAEPVIDWPNAPSDEAIWIQDDKPESGNDFSGWFNEQHADGKYSAIGSDKYVRSTGVSYTIHRRPMVYKNLLHKDKVDTDKWVDGLPPVGKWCLYDMVCGEKDLIEVYVVGYTLTSTVAFQRNHSSEIETNCDLSRFYPPKTAKQLEKESFIKAVRKELYKIETFIDQVGNRTAKENAIAEILYAARFTAPKGDES